MAAVRRESLERLALGDVVAVGEEEAPWSAATTGSRGLVLGRRVGVVVVVAADQDLGEVGLPLSSPTPGTVVGPVASSTMAIVHDVDGHDAVVPHAEWRYRQARSSSSPDTDQDGAKVELSDAR